MSIGNNIKNLRLKYGLDQAQFGEIAGVTDKAVSSWEKEKSIPRMGAIEKIATYFEIKKSDIIEDASTNNQNIPFSPFTYAMHKEEGKLTEEQKATILNMVKSFTKSNNQ